MRPHVSRLAVVLLIAATSGMAVPARAAGATNLAGTTIVRVLRTASVDVRLPRAVTLATPFGGSPDLAVSGGGSLAAFVLAGTESRTSATTIVGGGGHVNGGVTRFLMPVPGWPLLGGGTYEDAKTFADKTTVPAGSYRLYVVSAARATITLRLRGLTGRVTVAPGGKAVGAVLPPDQELVSNPASENVFAASKNHSLRRRGFALQALFSQIEADAAWQIAMCHDNPGEAVADPLRDVPGCPQGEKHTVVDRRFPETEPTTKTFVQAYAGLPPGEHGLSTVYANEGSATGISYATLWLEY